MQPIIPCLWFDQNAEEAAQLYVSVFPHSEILNVSRYTENAPMPAGTALVVNFTLDGIEFQALNGGPGHPHSDAVSFSITAPTQEDIDRFWDLLTRDGGSPGPCGWLTDRFGVSWQVVPPVLSTLLADPDPAAAGRVMQAMLAMSKLDISTLQAARDAA